MAGIILCLGNETDQQVQRMRHNFESCKGLQDSYVFRDNKCQIVKYQRKYDLKDNNWFESPEVMVCAVGTIIFKNYGIENSICEIGKALSKGAVFSEIANQIDGHYFLSIMQKRENELRLMTDVGGAINTYLIKKDGKFFVSTSMLALAQCFKVTPDNRSILTFIRSGMFFGDTTYFKEIVALKPASIYKYDFNTGALARHKYWSVPRNVNTHISLTEAAFSLKQALFHIIDNIPCENSIYDFTGGYDSRFVLSFEYSRQKNKKRVNAFFFGPPDSREAKIVRNNCVNLGIRYNNYLLPRQWSKIFFDYVVEANKLSDGMINACEYAPVLWIQKEKRKKFKYSILGLFGEIYRGFPAKQEFLMAGRRRLADIPRFIRFRNLVSSFEPQLFSSDVCKIISEIPKHILKAYEESNSILERNAPNTLQLDNIYFAHRMRRWGGSALATTNQLIQAICPLWYREALTVCFSLPHHVKLREKLMKYIVREIAPQLSVEKTISGAPFLLVNSNNIIAFIPAVIFYLLKAVRKFFEVVFKRSILGGLTLPEYQVSEWYREALTDPRCEDLLDHNNMISGRFYDKERFEGFIQDAKSPDFSFYTQLGNMITVELTLRSANLKS